MQALIHLDARLLPSSRLQRPRGGHEVNIRPYHLIVRQRLSMLEDASIGILHECGLWYHTAYNHIIHSRTVHNCAICKHTSILNICFSTSPSA